MQLYPPQGPQEVIPAVSGYSESGNGCVLSSQVDPCGDLWEVAKHNLSV